MEDKLFIVFWDNYNEVQSRIIESIVAPQDLTFGTKLHGGYFEARFSLLGPLNKSRERYRLLLSAHVTIHDYLGRRVWEGRVESAELTNVGVSFSVNGYYSHGGEVLDGLIYPGGVGTETYAHDIIKDALGLSAQSFGSATTWSEGDVFIKPTDVDLGYHDFSNDVRLSEAIEKATSYGYKTDDLRPVYFAIYNYRIAEFFPEPVMPPDFKNDIDWFIPASSFTYEGSWSMAMSRKNLWNKVWYLWDDNEPDSVGPTLSAAADEDALSQKMYGIREAVVNVNDVPEEVAQLVQDIFIDRNSRPRQSFSASITGSIKHMVGRVDEPYMIRAGDVIVVEDLDINVPLSASVVGGTNAAAGFVISTSYNYSDNTIKLEIGTDDKTLGIVLARWGIGGGLS